jgi:oligosaccharide 4-alpha-D-glucosyltransferase
MRFERTGFCWLISLLIMLTSPATAREYVRHSLNGQTLSITTNDGTVKLRALATDAFEIAYQPDGIKQLPSFALTDDTQSAKISVKEDAKSLQFRAGALTAIIDKSPFRLRYTREGQDLIAEESGLFVNDKGRGFRFRLSNGERLWGGGQRVLGMNRRGNLLPLDNRGAYNYSDKVDAMYYGVPAVISEKKYLLLFDNSSKGEIDLGKTEPDILRFEGQGGRTSYVIVAGQNYVDVVKNFVSVTGKQPLPPRWAFGNMASRFGYRTAAQTRDVVERHFKDGFPLDAVILDLFWFGPDIKGHLGNLDWDRNAFPDPEKMIADFKAKGVNTILITEPFILRTSKRWDEALANNALARDASGAPKTFDFYFGNGGLVDMFDPTASKWFWSKNRALLDQGVAGIWGDLGEPEAHPSEIIHAPGWGADEVHNAYGHQWARIMAENWKKAFPDQRPFLMMRSGFAGTQRYGIIPWSGDVSKSWAALQAQIEIALQMSVLGLAYSHSDLGGFVSLDPSSSDPDATVPFDKELYIRWLQFGAFQPVFRPHSQEQLPSEPVFQDVQTRDIVRRYIRARYRLLPYLYTTAWQNSQSGMPLTRPLAFEGDDPSLFEDQSAFLWGDNMLIAPVTEKGAKTKLVKFPAGSWFDFWSGARYQGGRSLSVPTSLDNIPVFVRAGAFVPMIGDIMTTRDYRTDQLSVHYYHDAAIISSKGLMYDDDGKSTDPQGLGRYEVLRFQSAFGKSGLAIDFARDRNAEYEGQPTERQIELVIHNWSSLPRQVVIGNKRLLTQKAVNGAAGREGFSYSLADRILKVRFAWKGDNVAINLR